MSVPVPAALPGGPYLQLAAFCDVVIEGKDGTLSLIRVVDRLTHQVVGPTASEQMPPVTHKFVLVIALKSGRARGPHAVKLVIERPSGLRDDGPTFTAMMEGEDHGQNLILNLQQTFSEQGLYWFDVLINDVLVTRVPWRVIYTRTLLPQPPG
jgi:hypothetical protein